MEETQSETPWSKGGEPKHRCLKSVSLADQKAEKPWSQRCRHPNLGFWSQCHLLIKRWRHPDERMEKTKVKTHQKMETPRCGFWSQCHLLIKRCRHPNIGFWSQCHLLIKRQRHPDEKMELRKPKSKTLADQTGGDTQIIGVWSQCHLLIQRWRHPDQKAGTPKLRCLQSVCHLLIKWWRQLPLLKVGT